MARPDGRARAVARPKDEARWPRAEVTRPHGRTGHPATFSDMMFRDSSSRLRRTVLAPAALAYAAGSWLHRHLWLRPRVQPRDHLVPLVVVGSLRAGGAGKTPVALELARYLAASGKRVGILAYRIAGEKRATFEEVFPASDWRASSDEAVWLARESARFGGRGGRVFVTRDRERAWDALSRTAEFDVLVSDDGWMDARLQGAFRIVLADRNERPGWGDLLPAGPYRRTAASLRDAEFVLYREDAADAASHDMPEPEGNEGWLHREVILPQGFDREEPHWVVCGIGNPRAFLDSLKRIGVRIAGSSPGPDHGLPDLQRAKRLADSCGSDRFLCTEKDFVKLEKHPDAPSGLFRAGERISLDHRLFSWLDARLVAPTS